MIQLDDLDQSYKPMYREDVYDNPNMEAHTFLSVHHQNEWRIQGRRLGVVLSFSFFFDNSYLQALNYSRMHYTFVFIDKNDISTEYILVTPL